MKTFDQRQKQKLVMMPLDTEREIFCKFIFSIRRKTKEPIDRTERKEKEKRSESVIYLFDLHQDETAFSER